MTLQETNKLAKHICRLLKVKDINIPIARTPKGNLGLVFNDNNDEFVMMLDSVPLNTFNILEDENNIELKKMIEKYWFDTFLGTANLTPGNMSAIMPVSTRVVGETTTITSKGFNIPIGAKKTNGNSKTKESS